jgi:hypothetical protein
VEVKAWPEVIGATLGILAVGVIYLAFLRTL